MLDRQHGREHGAIAVLVGPQLSPWTVNPMIRAVISSPMLTQSWDGLGTNLHRGVGVIRGNQKKKKKEREDLETGMEEEEKNAGLRLGLVQLIRQLGVTAGRPIARYLCGW